MSFSMATSVLALKVKKVFNLDNILAMDKTAATNVLGGGEAVKAGTQLPLQNYLPCDGAILNIEIAKVSMGELDVEVNAVQDSMVAALQGGDVNRLTGPFPALLPVYMNPFGSRKKLTQSKENQAQSIFWEVTQLLITGHREERLQIARRSQRQLIHYRSPSSPLSNGAPTSRPVTLCRIEVTQATKASIIVRVQVVNALLVLHGPLEYIRVLSTATAVLVLPVLRGPRPLLLCSVSSESGTGSQITAAPVIALDEPQHIQASDVRPRGLSMSSSMGDMSKYDFEDTTDDDVDATTPPLRHSKSVKDLTSSASSLIAPPSPPRTPVPSSPLALTPSKSIAGVGEAHSPAIVDGQGLPRSQSMTGRAMWFPQLFFTNEANTTAPKYMPTLPRAVLVRTTNHPPKSPCQASNALDIENPKKINITTIENKENAQPGSETASAGGKPKTVGSRSWRREQRILWHQQQNALAGASTSTPTVAPRMAGSRAWRGDAQRARYGQANPPMRLFGAALRQATPYQLYDPSMFFRGTPPPSMPPPSGNAGAASSRLRADAPIFRPSGHLCP